MGCAAPPSWNNRKAPATSASSGRRGEGRGRKGEGGLMWDFIQEGKNG